MKRLGAPGTQRVLCECLLLGRWHALSFTGRTKKTPLKWEQVGGYTRGLAPSSRSTFPTGAVLPRLPGHMSSREMQTPTPRLSATSSFTLMTGCARDVPTSGSPFPLRPLCLPPGPPLPSHAPFPICENPARSNKPQNPQELPKEPQLISMSRSVTSAVPRASFASVPGQPRHSAGAHLVHGWSSQGRRPTWAQGPAHSTSLSPEKGLVSHAVTHPGAVSLET